VGLLDCRLCGGFRTGRCYIDARIDGAFLRWLVGIATLAMSVFACVRLQRWITREQM
jgi:hypothetical protein